jgi:dTDP-4-amino-4,6-dideoxygalactose transaminase
MVFVNNEELHQLLVSVRVHGMSMTDKYDNDRLGLTARMDSMQAGVLLAKFGIFPGEIEKRQEVTARYAELLSDVDGLTPPSVPEGNVSVWAQYCVLARDTEQRTEVMEKLSAASIPSCIYYPKPLHLQKAFADLGYVAGDFPVSEDAASRIFALPMHPYLSAEEQETIVKAIKG